MKSPRRVAKPLRDAASLPLSGDEPVNQPTSKRPPSADPVRALTCLAEALSGSVARFLLPHLGLEVTFFADAIDQFELRLEEIGMAFFVVNQFGEQIA